MSLSSTRRGFTYCKVCPVFSGDSCVKEKKKEKLPLRIFWVRMTVKDGAVWTHDKHFFMYSPTGAFFFNSYIFIFLCNHQMFWVFFVFLHSKYRKTATHFQIRVTKLNERRCDVWRSWVTQHLGFIHRHLNRQDAVIYGSQVASEDERGFLNAVRPCSAPIWVTCRPPPRASVSFSHPSSLRPPILFIWHHYMRPCVWVQTKDWIWSPVHSWQGQSKDLKVRFTFCVRPTRTLCLFL